MNAAATPRALIAALGGERIAPRHWPPVFAMAVRGWLGPALGLAIERAGGAAALGAPADMADYLAHLHRCNRERNRRLRGQLVEATAALNAADIRPVLLKGAIGLFRGPDDALGWRMMSDLDLAIDPAERDRARAALAAIGFRGSPEGDMGREGDVGMLELHVRPSARSKAYLDRPLGAMNEVVSRGGAEALLPSPTARALHLIVHDLVKQGDYWRLRLDLRHAIDLAALAWGGAVDWPAIEARMADPRARRALALQRHLLHDLFALPAPGGRAGDRATRLAHRLRLAGAGGGPARIAARALGNLRWALHRLPDAAGEGDGRARLAHRARALFATGASAGRL